MKTTCGGSARSEVHAGTSGATMEALRPACRNMTLRPVVRALTLVGLVLLAHFISAATSEISWADGPPNGELAGQPEVAGLVGRPTLLRAVTDGISDGHGPRGAVFEYQWLGVRGSAESEIADATRQQYEARLADGYDGYKLRVTYIDEGGRRKTLTSATVDIRQHVVSNATRLPDLVSTPPDDVWIHRADAGDVRLLPVDGTQNVYRNEQPMLLMAFRTSVRNIGAGPLDVSGNPQLADSADATSHDTWQRTLTADDDWVKLTQPPVRYETADGHLHFHLMKLAEYSLWDDFGQTRVQTAPKVGFCLQDSYVIPGATESNTTVAYFDNCRSEQPEATGLTMGISAGVMDIYDRGMAFQWVDVSDVRPGLYRLAGQVDPDDLIWESDETNNGIALSDDVLVIPGYAAQDQETTTLQGSPVSVTLIAQKYGVTGALRFRVVEGPGNGTLDVDEMAALSNPTVNYTPNFGFAGSDSFLIEAFDAGSDFPRTPVRATVTILVRALRPNADGGGNGVPLTVEVQNAPDNVRRNIIHPGIVDTPLQAPYLTDELREEFRSSILLCRIAQPREIANAALFLASDEASYVTGAKLVIDGGFMAQ